MKPGVWQNLKINKKLKDERKYESIFFKNIFCKKKNKYKMS